MDVKTKQRTVKLMKFFFREDFAEIFFFREGKELLGRKLSNFWFLYCIFFLTFFAIGFANGSLRYLEKKMSNPFIKYVPVSVPLTHSDRVMEIKKKMEEDTIAMRTYSYKTVTGYNIYSLHFWDKKNKGTRSFDGRSLDIENNLLKEILAPPHYIAGRTFQSKYETGLIVTENLLAKLNMPKKSGFIMMAFSSTQDPGKDREVALPIIAVVKELPDLCEFMTTQYFQSQRCIGIDLGNPFDPGLARGVSLLTMKEMGSAEKYKKLIQEFFKDHTEFASMDPWVEVRENTLSYLPSCQINITLVNDTSLAVRDRIFSFVNQIPEVRKYCFRFYDYTAQITPKSLIEIQFDRLTIEFEKLDKIGEFKEFLKTKHEIVMDMAQVEALKNYNFVSKLTQIISLILIAFSILSICIFVTNLLRTHLYKIKMNIGTFSAFGLDPNVLERIYLAIIIAVITISMLIGILTAWLVGVLGCIRGILSLLNLTLEEGQNYFEMLNWYTLISVLSVLIISFVFLKYTARKIFRQTPGDLIYDRT
jgi:hypothetical protein